MGSTALTGDPLTTERLTLRCLQTDDAPSLVDAIDESWNDLSQWMLWATDRPSLIDITKCRAYISNCQSAFQTGRDYTFGGFDRVTGRLILISRLAVVPDQPTLYEFCGYWCRTTEQNKGYITEAVRAIADFAFHHLKTDKLMITHAAGNHATRAVMDKVGFIETNVLKGVHALPDGRSVDRHILWLFNPL